MIIVAFLEELTTPCTLQAGAAEINFSLIVVYLWEGKKRKRLSTLVTTLLEHKEYRVQECCQVPGTLLEVTVNWSLSRGDTALISGTVATLSITREVTKF